MVKNGNFTLLLTSSSQEWQFLVFRVNLGIWPLNQSSWKNEQSSEGLNTHFWCFWGNRWENVHFSTKSRHVTPQIDCLREMSPVLRVSTHINGVSKDIGGNIHFSTKPRHVTPQIDCLRKTSSVPRVSTHMYGVYKDIGGKMYIFQLNLGMWPLKSIILEKWALFQGFQHTFMVFPRR